MSLSEIQQTLDTLTQTGHFCGVGICTGAHVEIPVVMNPDGERVALSVTVACCIFCSPAIIECFPGALELI